ncbi:MAG TPA: hypothetical protein VLJ37_05675 [bacterium]|nr:hypothetical protein [bacterium]
MQALSLGIQSVLNGYYASAAHRQALALPDPVPGQPLHFFRAMCHFEPATPFLNELRSSGFSPRVFRLPDGEESYLLDPWPLTALRAVEHFSRRPEDIGERPVFVGHSAGGFAVYLLAALADGADVASYREVLSGLDLFGVMSPIRAGALRDLACALSGALFVSIGTPYAGVEFRRIGHLLNRHFFEPQSPLLLKALQRSYLDPLYRRLGAKPGRVIHGQMISPDDPVRISRNPSSFVYETILQGGMRLVARMTEFDLYDGIAPWSATYVPEMRDREVLASDHLRMVEDPEPAARLVRLITRLKAWV